jgi:HPr kinase/phosphorylase
VTFLTNKTVPVQELLNDMPYLEVVSGEDFLDRKLEVSDLSRPALELTGYFDYYPQDRVQLLGKTEVSFLNRMTVDERKIIIKRLCDPETPVFIISRGQEVPKELTEIATKNEIPVLVSTRNTTRLSANIMNFLEENLSERMDQHGVLVEIYGMGVLIIGESGIGKSETALELIQRGHRLVADDRVELYMMDESRIIGEAPEILRHLIEIRGLGVIDVVNMFGVGAVRESTVVDMIINLRSWNKEQSFDRLGNNIETKEFFNVDLPMLHIPVRVGRNLATIIEVAAMNIRAKGMGYDATAQFEENLTNLIEKNKKTTSNNIELNDFDEEGF